tara:strand:- start:118 stop:1164 length:1047 start_codon:yes stop_codon:yes gene_type:complete
MDRDLEKILFQPLLGRKKYIQNLNTYQVEQLLSVANRFLLSGFLLNYHYFDNSSKFLKNNLIKINKEYLKKLLLIDSKVIELSKLFHKQGIEHVFMKGTALKFGNYYSNNERQYRDIDILVKSEDLMKAYSLAKELKFKYMNSKTSDSVKYFEHSHQLPVMLDENRVPLEIHHRVTSPIFFDNCPLKDSFFKNKVCHGSINIPCDEDLLLHSFYHGIKHDYYSIPKAPIFLFDFINICKKNNNSFFKIQKKMKIIGLDEEYEILDKIYQLSISKKKLDSEVLKYIRKITSNFNWSESQRKRKINLHNILYELKHIRYLYQTSFFSFKYISILLSDIKRYFFKKTNNLN